MLFVLDPVFIVATGEIHLYNIVSVVTLIYNTYYPPQPLRGTDNLKFCNKVYAFW